MKKLNDIIIPIEGIVPVFDNAFPNNFDSMSNGNIKILVIRALFKDNVIHKNTMNNFPITLEKVFIKQVFNCDTESSYGYRHEVSNHKNFHKELIEIGFRMPFGCNLYHYEEMKYEGDRIIFCKCSLLA